MAANDLDSCKCNNGASLKYVLQSNPLNDDSIISRPSISCALDPKAELDFAIKCCL